MLSSSAAPDRLPARAPLAVRLRHAGAVLRREPVGGAVLLVATVIAVVWANSPLAGAYEALQDTRVGPSALHLDLTLQSWTADGLLAVFFFVVGLELKREFVEGDLRDPRHALVPIAGAVGGVAAPALVYVLVTSVAGSDALNGWAVPAATDIAFAVAVFAVLGRGLPPALRLFLLTLAVVDDLLAITIIAFAYTAELNVVFLALAALPLAAFALLLRRGVTRLWVLLPLGVVVWALVHESGVHATVAGVALGLAVPAGALAARFEHAWQPWSMGVAVPAFALLSAGVALGGASGLGDALTDGVVLAVIAGLVVGKPLGILGATWITARLTAARLDASLRWADIAAVATLSGIGFTVSLLVGEIAFGADGERLDHVKIGVLCGSAVAAILGGLLLRRRARRVGG